MRVAIVTVFNEYFNYGSFLQAFALQEYLHEHDIQAELIQEFSFRRVKNKIRGVLTKDVKRLRFNVTRFAVYTFANRKLNSVQRFANRKYDAAILGSDEIWNLKNRTFDHSPIFFGDNIKADLRISYAPSANGMTFDDFANSPREKSALGRIEYLSARDPRTVELVKSVTSRDVVEVLDPTFLIDWSGYEKTNTPSNYILVYCYDLSEQRIQLIEELAQQRNAKIISIGHYSNTKHSVIVVDPFLFLGYIKNALAVVTDSYHGTILSMQYNKPFCSFVGHNYKIDCVLEMFGLNSQNATKSTNLTEIFNQEIDYKSVNRLISERKKISIQFLNNALGIKS